MRHAAASTVDAQRLSLWDRWLGGLRRSSTASGYALISPTLLVMLVGLGAPLLLLIGYSFGTNIPPSAETTGGIDPTPTLARYEEVFGRDVYRNVFLRTIGVASLATFLTVALSYPVAYYLAFHVKRTKMIWLILLTIPFWTSYLLRAFSLKIILGYNGVINSGLISAGLIEAPIEVLLYSTPAVIIALTHAYAAFAILPIYVSLEAIDRTLLETSSDLGDGPWSQFWRVTFPLSLPGVLAATLLIFVPVAGDYVTPSLVGGTQGQLIATLVQAQFVELSDWPLGAALAISAIAGVAVFVLLFTTAMRLAVRAIK